MSGWLICGDARYNLRLRVIGWMVIRAEKSICIVAI
jgi:hypothetical protein